MHLRIDMICRLLVSYTGRLYCSLLPRHLLEGWHGYENFEISRTIELESVELESEYFLIGLKGHEGEIGIVGLFLECLAWNTG